MGVVLAVICEAIAGAAAYIAEMWAIITYCFIIPFGLETGAEVGAAAAAEGFVFSTGVEVADGIMTAGTLAGDFVYTPLGEVVPVMSGGLGESIVGGADSAIGGLEVLDLGLGGADGAALSVVPTVEAPLEALPATEIPADLGPNLLELAKGPSLWETTDMAGDWYDMTMTAEGPRFLNGIPEYIEESKAIAQGMKPAWYLPAHATPDGVYTEGVAVRAYEDATGRLFLHKIAETTVTSGPRFFPNSKLGWIPPAGLTARDDGAADLPRLVRGADSSSAQHGYERPSGAKNSTQAESLSPDAIVPSLGLIDFPTSPKTGDLLHKANEPNVQPVGKALVKRYKHTGQTKPQGHRIPRNHHNNPVSGLDGTILPTIPFRPTFVTRFRAEGRDAQKEAERVKEKVKGKELDVKWWDRWSGTAHVCWKDSPNTCGMMEGLFLYCWDWNNTRVPDAIPKLSYPGQDAFLPNGSISIPPPDEQTALHGVWSAPIAGSCKYWDKDFKFPTLAFGETDPEKLKKAFEDESWLPPVKKIPNLAPGRPSNARRDIASLTESHFTSLPPKDSSAALEDFAADGAALIHVQLRSNRSSDGTANILRRHMEIVLDTHAEHRNSLWKRMTQVHPADTNDILAALVNELVSTSHDDDKSRVKVYAAGAIIEAVASRAAKGKKVGKSDFGALEQGFYTVFGDEMFPVPGQNITKAHLRPRLNWR